MKASIKIGKREIELACPMLAMEAIEEKWGDLRGMMEALKPESKKQFSSTCEILTIMGNAALELKGEDPDLTHRWIALHMNPKQCQEAGVAIGAALNAAMNTEVDAEEEKPQEGPRDLVLEEIQKKD